MTRALTGMGRVQHTSTSLVLCFFFAFEGNRISTTCRFFTCSGSKSSKPLTLLLIACPDPVINFAVLLFTSFVSSNRQTNLQGTRSLSLRSCRVGISILGFLYALPPDPLGRDSAGICGRKSCNQAAHSRTEVQLRRWQSAKFEQLSCRFFEVTP